MTEPSKIQYHKFITEPYKIRVQCELNWTFSKSRAFLITVKILICSIHLMSNIKFQVVTLMINTCTT